MPDIIICTNDDCSLSNSCWRFNSAPSQYDQSYTKFEPTINDEDEVECEMYLEMTSNEKSDVVRINSS